jgi:hypothetical protein
MFCIEYGAVLTKRNDCQSTGLYVLTLDATRYLLKEPKTVQDVPFPNLSISMAQPWQAETFSALNIGRFNISCLQLTDRRILFSWDVNDRALTPYNAPPRKSYASALLTDHMPFIPHNDGDEDEMIAHPGMMALIPWGHHSQVGCIDLCLLSDPA